MKKNDDDLFDLTFNAVNSIQKQEDFSSIVDDILDDDVKTLLDKISTINQIINPKTEKESVESSIENTKIGSIAKEIASELDLSKLNINKPEDLLSGQNANLIGDLVSKVSAKLQSKFQSNELKHDDLLKEAMGMMGSFGGGAGGGGGGDLFANIMKSMAGMNMPQQQQSQSRDSSHDQNKTKERLRKKLEAKKADA
jgi:hypothetical protein